jgi:hypothetical protein
MSCGCGPVPRTLNGGFCCDCGVSMDSAAHCGYGATVSRPGTGGDCWFGCANTGQRRSETSIANTRLRVIRIGPAAHAQVNWCELSSSKDGLFQ